MHYDLPSLIQAIGHLGLFAIIFAESGLFFGFFFPGDSLLFTAGFLASQNILNLPLLLIGAFLAAVAGDNVGYAFGKKIGPKIFTREDSIIFHRKHIERTQKFFATHGAKSIVLARFIPIVRTFTPILAGVGQMRYPTFLTYNLIGGAIWAIGIPLIGYWLGQTVADADKYLLPIVLFIVATSFLPPLWHLYKDRQKNKNI